MILGVLVWNKLITLEIAHKLVDSLGTKIIPNTIEEVIEELEKASK